MNYLVDDQPIVACSTSMSDNAAIGVIRLSGFANLDYIADFFSKSDFKPNTAKFTKLIHLDKVIDEVVVTFFQAPHSYNGENVLEISAHGNILNLRRIIGIFVNSKKFRMAANGEFTYRALKNKKLNLSQVEGLDLLLNANSTLMLDQGLNILNGDISKKYHKLYDAFLHLKSSIEINIDFAEDVGEEQSLKLLDNAVRGVGDLIRSLHASANVSKKYFATPSVTVVGEPNAGKSSLFNAILNDNRAIVSPIAGTTRDFITEYIEIADNNFKLVDTAGLRFTKDVIEEEGIKRATNLIGESFFKVLVVDVTKISEFSFVFSRDLKFDLLVLNHADEINKNFEIPDFINIPAVSNYLICSVKNDIIYSSGSIGPENSISGSIGPILENIKSGSIGPETKIGGSIGPENNTTGSMGPETKLGGSIGPSSKISDFVTKMVGHDFAKIQALDPISIDRHRNLINEISISYETFSSNINNIGDMAIISSEAHILGTKISELIGILSPDDILNNIFSNFCIGK